MKKLIFLLSLYLNISYLNAQEWQWAKRIGAETGNRLTRTEVDQHGNIFLAGVYGRDFGLFGSDTLYHNSVDDHIYVARIDQDGEFLWSCDVGGVEDGSRNGVSIQSSPSDTSLIVYFTTSGPEQVYCDSMLALNGQPITPCTYLAKIDYYGGIKWIRSMGVDFYNSWVVVHESGDIFTIVRNANQQLLNFGGSNLEVGYNIVRISGSDGQCNWHKRYADELMGLTAFEYKNGQFYMSGRNLDYLGCNIDTINWIANYHDIYMCGFDTLGSVQWLKTFGGLGDDRAKMAISSSGQVYSHGTFTGAAQFGQFSLDNDGRKDWFVALHDSIGNPIWIRQAFATDSIFMNELTTDSNGNLYCTGSFSGSITIGGQTATASSLSPYTDMFIVKCDSLGNCSIVTTVPTGVYYYDTPGSISIASPSPTELLVHAQYFKDSLNLGGTYLLCPDYNAIFVAKLDLTTSVQSRENGTGELFIYANPTTGLCNITVPQEFANEHGLVLQVTDMNGHKVSDQRIDLRQQRIKLDLRALAKGVYNASLSNGRKVYHGRIVFE